ncbi:MAG: heavy-metal-associated domain-containing protein [Dehalococcoidia bacterium]
MAQTITFDITGMTCEHCVKAITTAVKDVPGVLDVKVSLESNSAEVSGELVDVEKVMAAVAEEGYAATTR